MEGHVNASDARIEEFWNYYGRDPRTSDWVEVSQALIDQFSEATLDPDWMHIDPERSRRDGPFDGTIAFGFWTMSMLTYFNRVTTGAEYPPGAAYGFNYGFNRVRLMAPVPTGARIRNHMKVVDIAARGDGRYLVTSENRIEIEGQEKPAMVAEWLGMLVFD